MSLELLKQQYSRCCKCPALCQSRTQVVFGSGNEKSKILFIGEAPGGTEDKQGIPFCGMSGKILSELLAHIGVSREDVFITNTILCRPQDNRNPAKEEVQNCRERLDKLIEIMQPKVIVTIGNFATERILDKTGITTLRGKIFPTIINNKEIKVVPVIHPAGYLYSGRNPELLAQMKADFEAIARVIDDKKQQKSLGDY
ncbi:MAG: uracil-DNA glycosylase [Candidatus Woesearchaeota archaeon]